MISIHRALAELKTLDDRIIDEINGAKFVALRIGQKDKTTSGQLIATAEKNIFSSYDKIVALIARRKQVKSAVVLSNAGITPDMVSGLKRIMVGGVSMTVAEAIEYKTSIGYEETLLKSMLDQYSKARVKLEKDNQEVQKRLDEYLKNMFGAEAQKTQTEDVKAHTEQFLKMNETSLIDPLNLENKIQTLKDTIFAFTTDVDASLSEANATTMIDL